MGDLNFTDLNFVDTCEIIQTSTSTISYCYSTAGSLNQILIMMLLFIFVAFGIIKLINKRTFFPYEKK